MDHELSKFLAVAQWRSFSKAAKDLNISQPALSMAIKNLERSLKNQLIVRDASHFALTEAGKVVFDSARRMQIEATTMVEILEQSKIVATSHFRLGAIDSISELLLGRGEILEGLRLEITVDSSSRLIRDVGYLRLDLALVTSVADVNKSDLKYEKVGQEEFVLVCHPDIAKEAKEKLKNGHLLNWLAYNKQSSTFELLNEQFSKRNIQAAPIFYSTSPELIRLMAVQGKGVAALPKEMVRKDLKSHRLEIISLVRLSRPIWAVYRNNQQNREIIDGITRRVSKLLSNI